MRVRIQVPARDPRKLLVPAPLGKEENAVKGCPGARSGIARIEPHMLEAKFLQSFVVWRRRHGREGQ